jgi:hypothetical protein
LEPDLHVQAGHGIALQVHHQGFRFQSLSLVEETLTQPDPHDYQGGVENPGLLVFAFILVEVLDPGLDGKPKGSPGSQVFGVTVFPDMEALPVGASFALLAPCLRLGPKGGLLLWTEVEAGPVGRFPQGPAGLAAPTDLRVGQGAARVVVGPRCKG